MLPYNNGNRFGKVARFILSNFASVSVLDLTLTDTDLNAFLGGWTDGNFGYLVPYNCNNGNCFGKVAGFGWLTLTIFRIYTTL